MLLQYPPVNHQMSYPHLNILKILPLSMTGHSNSVKLLCFPRFLYLCQNFSNFLMSAFLKEMDNIILSYIWNHENHRILKPIYKSQNLRVDSVTWP